MNAFLYVTLKTCLRNPVFHLVTLFSLLSLLLVPAITFFVFEDASRLRMIHDMGISTLLLGGVFLAWLFAPLKPWTLDPSPLALGFLSPLPKRRIYCLYFLQFELIYSIYIFLCLPLLAFGQAGDYALLQDRAPALLGFAAFLAIFFGGGTLFLLARPPGASLCAPLLFLAAYAAAAAAFVPTLRAHPGPSLGRLWERALFLLILVSLWYALFLFFRVWFSATAAAVMSAAAYLACHLPAILEAGGGPPSFVLSLIPRMDLVFPASRGEAQPLARDLANLLSTLLHPGSPRPLGGALWISLYGLGYTLALLSAGSFAYSRREGT